MLGMITGPGTSLSVRRSSRERPCARLMASGSPSDSARALVARPISRLRQVAAIQSREPRYRRYHLSDNAGGGNCRYSAELKDTGITTMSGAIRNANTRAQLMRKHLLDHMTRRPSQPACGRVKQQGAYHQ